MATKTWFNKPGNETLLFGFNDEHVFLLSFRGWKANSEREKVEEQLKQGLQPSGKIAQATCVPLSAVDHMTCRNGIPLKVFYHGTGNEEPEPLIFLPEDEYSENVAMELAHATERPCTESAANLDLGSSLKWPILCLLGSVLLGAILWGIASDIAANEDVRPTGSGRSKGLAVLLIFIAHVFGVQGSIAIAALASGASIIWIIMTVVRPPQVLRLDLDGAVPSSGP